MDYSAWVSRVQAFTERMKTSGVEVVCDIAPPVTAETMSRLKAELRLPVPYAVEHFLLEGSASCFFNYSLPLESKTPLPSGLDFLDKAVSGGAHLCPDQKMAEYLNEAYAWATDTWIAEYPEDQSFWLNSLPILEVGNGDYLAVHADQHKDDPPVVYLCHEDESRVIAPSFTAFLQAWERLCYIHPDLAVLDPFIDADTGYLSSKAEAAHSLRILFQAE